MRNLAFPQMTHSILRIFAGNSSAFTVSERVPRLFRAVLLGLCITVAAVQAPAQATTLGRRLAADLTWSQAEREQRFAHMGRLFPVNVVRAGGRARALPVGRSLKLPGLPLHDVMLRDRLAGVLVLQHGAVRLEAYGLETTRDTRWTSFSVAKSMTSTLVGAAIVHGAIRSVDDAVTTYLPELRSSAYDGVTVRQLLTMTTGVRWIEAYDAPDSDNVRLYQQAAEPGSDAVVHYIRGLPRVHTPGSVWNYNTGEADLAGVLVRRATGKTLAALLSDAVWRPFGMERSATWIADSGREFGGSGVSATLRDYGRFGLFALRGGAGLVSPDWFAQATQPAAGSVANGRGYGMGWWTFADGSYAALGIFGQSILVDPKRDLVVVMLGAWPQAAGASLAASRAALWQAVNTVVDAETRAAAPAAGENCGRTAPPRRRHATAEPNSPNLKMSIP